MKLQGMFVDATTPFDHNGEIYQVKVQHNIEKWNRTGVSGYVLGGHAGEGALLSAADRRQLWRIATGCKGEGKILIAGIDRADVREASELARCAAECGMDVVLADPPPLDLAPSAHEAALLYFRALADRSPVPVIASRKLPRDSLALLSQHPNICAVLAGALVPQVREGVAVLTDSEQVLWQSLQAGANGAILAFASAFPYATIALWEAFRTREEAAGLDWQARIGEAASRSLQAFGIPGLKCAMDVNGYYGGPPRLPLRVLTPGEQKQVEEAFHGLRG